MKLTTVSELDTQLQRLWDQGEVLRSVVTREALFPLRLRLRVPTASDVAERFDDVRVWIGELRSTDHYRIESQVIRHRVHGSNAVPTEAWVDTIEQATNRIGKDCELECFRTLVDVTRTRHPQLLPWLTRNALRALASLDTWNLLLDVVDWFRANPKSGIYIRQIDLPGVHSKFIETHRGVLAELLDLSVPADSIDASANGVSQFARRYGLRDKPLQVRFRMLDHTCALFPNVLERDITLDAPSFARLNPKVSTVFVTENEINFLALPDVPTSLVIFGKGFGFGMLAGAKWLAQCRILYWGDIDTHGFAILDQLRSHWPHAESLMMDRETLMAFSPLWGVDAQPTLRDLPRLTRVENELFNDLRNNKIGNNLRLEQERIGFHWVQRELHRIAIPTHVCADRAILSAHETHI